MGPSEKSRRGGGLRLRSDLLDSVRSEDRRSPTKRTYVSDAHDAACRWLTRRGAPGADKGADISDQTCADTGADTGAEADTRTGADMGAEVGAKAGAKTGAEMGAETNAKACAKDGRRDGGRGPRRRCKNRPGCSAGARFGSRG